MCLRTYVSLIVCLLCQMDGFKETAKKREKKRSIWCFFLNLTSFFPFLSTFNKLFLILPSLFGTFSICRVVSAWDGKRRKERKRNYLCYTLLLFPSSSSFYKRASIIAEYEREEEKERERELLIEERKRESLLLFLLLASSFLALSSSVRCMSFPVPLVSESIVFPWSLETEVIRH